MRAGSHRLVQKILGLWPLITFHSFAKQSYNDRRSKPNCFHDNCIVSMRVLLQFLIETDQANVEEDRVTSGMGVYFDVFII